MTILRARRLTTFSVAPDGSSIAIGIADEEGKAGALMLPADCLKELMMTLPEMMRRALRQQHSDPSLRLVYSTAGWEIERSKLPGTFIVTFRTPDGFHVSFALTATDLCEMVDAVRSPALEPAPEQPKQRSVH
jgi:hypothetical protein